MLKLMVMLLFTLIFSFKKNFFWLIQMVLFFSCFLFILFNNINMYWGSISYLVGSDLISYGMILLSLWISCLMLMASEKIFFLNNYYNFFLMIVMVLLILLLFTFSSMNLFMFYLFFEGSLIPTMFLIMGWGYQPERLQAGLYLLFYTLMASLPMMMGIFFLYSVYNTLFFSLLLIDYNNLMLYMSMIMAFLVKMPMYLFHLWLPKAHVEAPISGSMILAGVLLKLGGYGLLRIFPMDRKSVV